MGVLCVNEGVEQREGKWAGGRLGGWVGVACVKDGMGRQRVRDEWGRVGGRASGKGGADAMCLVFVFYEFSFHCVDFYVCVSWFGNRGSFGYSISH